MRPPAPRPGSSSAARPPARAPPRPRPQPRTPPQWPPAPQAGEGAEARLNGLLALYAAAKAPKAKYATLLQVRRAEGRTILCAVWGRGTPLRALQLGAAQAAARRAWLMPDAPPGVCPPPPSVRQALSYAAASEPLAAQLAGAARGRPGEWVRQWHLTDDEARALYLTASQLLRVRASTHARLCALCVRVWVWEVAISCSRQVLGCAPHGTLACACVGRGRVRVCAGPQGVCALGDGPGMTNHEPNLIYIV